MKEFLLALLLSILLVIVLTSLGGCQKSLFWEQYEKAPVQTSSLGSGITSSQSQHSVPHSVPQTQTVREYRVIYCWYNGNWFKLNPATNEWIKVREELPICVPQK